MGMFQDLNDLSTPWRFSLGDWKSKIQDSSVGSPIHGLRAGYEATKLGSAYRFKQGIGRMNDGQNPFSSEFIKGTANDQGNNVASWGKENWPVALGFLGSWAGGAGAAGGGSSADTGLGAAMDGLSGGSSGGGGLIGLGSGTSAAAPVASSTLPEIVVTGSQTSAGPAIASVAGGAGSGITLSNSSSGDSGNNWFDKVKQYKSMMPQQGNQQQQQQQQPQQQSIYRDWTLSPQEQYQQALAMALAQRGGR